MANVLEDVGLGASTAGLVRTPSLRPALWYAASGALIAAPLFRGGYLLLLDLVLARRAPVQWWPTVTSPGPVNSAPSALVLSGLTRLGYAAGPLLVFLLFTGMGLGAHYATNKLVNPRHRATGFFVGTLYAINPFTYERLMAGHVLLLASYALAPFLLVAFDTLLKEPNKRTALTVLALLVGVAWTSIHYIVMLPVLLAPMLVLALARRKFGSQHLRWSAAIAVLFLIANSWWIAGALTVPPGTTVGAKDVGVYTTLPQNNAVIGNVAALYGFWRQEFRLPKDGVTAWWLLFIPVAALALTGLVTSLKDKNLRPVGITFLVVLPIAALLATGTSFSPTKGAFLWLYDNLPGFKIFREPQKWVALLPLGYAILGAIGLERLLPERRSKLAAAGALVVILIPIAYSWTLVWNFDRLKPARFPRDWAVADRMMQSDRTGGALFLPWHLYMTLSFTGTRVANPAPAYFSTRVISGDNLEVPGIQSQSNNPDSRLIEATLFTNEGRERLADILTKLCIRWVIFAQEVDAQNYFWLDRSPALEKTHDGPRLTLWRFKAPLEARCGVT